MSDVPMEGAETTLPRWIDVLSDKLLTMFGAMVDREAGRARHDRW